MRIGDNLFGANESGQIFAAVKQLNSDEDKETPFDQDLPSLENRFRSAARDGNTILIRTLLDGGEVNVNCKHEKTKQTALHSACAAANLEAVKLLLTYKEIDLEPQDTFKNTPTDLLPNTKVGKTIREMIKSQLQQSERGEENIVQKYGEICEIWKLGSYKNHLYICHDYRDNAIAKTIQGKLTKLGVFVEMSSGMMGNPTEIKKKVESCKMVLVLGSRTFFEKAKDPIQFSRSGCVNELDSFANSIDVSNILIAAVDPYAKKLDRWEECEDYNTLAEEGVIFDLSNEKAISENFGLLYKEIKMRVMVDKLWQ